MRNCASFPRLSGVPLIASLRASFCADSGSNLLKHTRFGQPHLRQFQLSADRRRLLWYSSSKAVGEAVVHLSDVKGICVGQHSATFRNFRLPALKHLSFSLVLGAEEEADSTADSAEDGGRAFSCDSQGDALKAVVLRGPLEEDAQTLDLTCKDEAEFDLWLCGLKALVAFHKNVLLSKTDLLSHSKRFRFVKLAPKNPFALLAPPVKRPGQRADSSSAVPFLQRGSPTPTS